MDKRLQATRREWMVKKKHSSKKPFKIWGIARLLRRFFQMALPLLKAAVPMTAVRRRVLRIALSFGCGWLCPNKNRRLNWPGRLRPKDTIKKYEEN
jgi:hypothetical protein